MRFFVIALSLIFACCHSSKKDKTEGEFKPLFSDLQKPEPLWNKNYVVNQIARYGRVDGQYIGIGASKSIQYARYQILCTYHDTILVGLTDHESPAVRVCAFDALVARHSTSVLSVFEKHINDTSVFKTLGG